MKSFKIIFKDPAILNVLETPFPHDFGNNTLNFLLTFLKWLFFLPPPNKRLPERKPITMFSAVEDFKIHSWAWVTWRMAGCLLWDLTHFLNMELHHGNSHVTYTLVTHVRCCHNSSQVECLWFIVSTDTVTAVTRSWKVLWFSVPLTHTDSHGMRRA